MCLHPAICSLVKDVLDAGRVRHIGFYRPEWRRNEVVGVRARRFVIGIAWRRTMVAIARLACREPVGVCPRPARSRPFRRILRCSSVTKLRRSSLIVPRFNETFFCELVDAHTPTGS
jgi:hypothetical protein